MKSVVGRRRAWSCPTCTTPQRAEPRQDRRARRARERGRRRRARAARQADRDAHRRGVPAGARRRQPRRRSDRARAQGRGREGGRERQAGRRPGQDGRRRGQEVRQGERAAQPGLRDGQQDRRSPTSSPQAGKAAGTVDRAQGLRPLPARRRHREGSQRLRGGSRGRRRAAAKSGKSPNERPPDFGSAAVFVRSARGDIAFGKSRSTVATAPATVAGCGTSRHVHSGAC